MKLLIIIHETSIFNGAYKSAKILFDGLKAKGVDMLIVTPNKEGAYEALRGDGFNTVCVRGFGYYYWADDYRFKQIRETGKRALETLWIAKMLPIVHRFKPDIIYSNSGSLECGYRLARLTHIRHIAHLREFVDKDFKLSTSHIERMIRNEDSYFISVIKKIAEVRGIDGNPKCRVIYNAITFSDSKITPPHSRKYFLYVGTITEGKGTYDLIRAYAQYARAATSVVPLRFAGGHPDQIAAARHLCSKLGIDSHIEFLGQRHDVYDLMSSALAVIVPSFFEAFGRVMPESMANNTLVIARDTAGMKEHFDNGLRLTGREIGFRFTDHDSLIDALIRASAMDDDEYLKTVKAAYDTARTFYSPGRLADEVHKFLCDITH